MIISSALLLGGAFVLVYQAIDPATSNIYPECTIYKHWHLYCPSCGSQRAIHQLLKLNFKKAFAYNALVMIILPLLLYWVGILGYNFLFDKPIRIKLFNSNRFIIVFLVVIILYFILRNLPFPIFDFLRPE